MAHELFGTRFLDNRKPAWHRIGNVVTDPLGAEEAFDRVGAYDIVKVPLVPITATLGDELASDLDSLVFNEFALVRTSTHDAPAHHLGTVKAGYEIVTPREFVQAWDRAIDQPVETLGSLKKGGVLFISTHLGGYELKGDPDEAGENYLLAYNGMTGTDAIRFDVTSIRAVCANTVRLGQEVASETLVLPHSKKGLAEFEVSLADAFARAQHRVGAVQEAMTILANAKATPEAVEAVLEAVYPAPKRPSDYGPKLIVERREEIFVWRNTFALGSRESVKELIEGAATCNTKTAAGTMWGVYSAIVEFEDYRSHRASAATIGENALVGSRAATKEKAFAVTMAAIRN